VDAVSAGVGILEAAGCDSADTKNELKEGATMTRSALLVPGIAACLGLSVGTAAVGQTARSPVDRKAGLQPVITAVSQVGYRLGHTDIVIEGRNFPETGVQIVMGPDRAVPSSPQTATKMAGTLGPNTEPGKIHKVALYRHTTRISNEVDYLFLYQLHDVAQGSRMKPGDVVDIRNNQSIGARRSKIVKFGSQTASIIAWDPNQASIRVRVPEGLPPMSSQPITLEEDGKLISNTITVTVSSIPVYRK